MKQDNGGMGCAPAMGATHGIGAGGIPMKKKVWPKSEPKKLTEKVGWKKSFNVFTNKPSSTRKKI